MIMVLTVSNMSGKSHIYERCQWEGTTIAKIEEIGKLIHASPGCLYTHDVMCMMSGCGQKVIRVKIFLCFYHMHYERFNPCFPNVHWRPFYLRSGVTR